ncbi:MAG: 2-oxoglutarate dehydrogenase E1 component [Candidatus Eisenbacteria bacterium]|nr:2-oxoglutarate dehydrogenase E1 component [Candidatus Eisenbacteria bacterium]
MSDRLDFIQRANAAYIEELYARYRRDPASVGEDWALFFAGFDLAGSRPGGGVPGQPSGELFGLVQHHRVFGHLAARLDPLGGVPPLPPLLDLANFGFAAADLDRAVAAAPFKGEFHGTLGELVAALRLTYCDTIGVEYMGITDPERREWLQERMEPVRNHPPLAPEDRLRVLRQLLTADGFEEFLNTRYPGQKRFSLEGAGALVPMLDTLLETAAAGGAGQVVIGMPHRGRLNVLANIMQKPCEAIFNEFETSFLPEDVQGHGDVKYHLGYSRTMTTRAGRPLHVDLNFNPSHLEFVNPVVLGNVRARQDHMKDAGRDGCIPVLLHGDAAFAGEGIVPETLALAQLPAYQTGGTIHVVVNNQVGFTTSPKDARVSRYVTDVARVEDAPMLHVNADDPEACVHVMALAVQYRARFKRDVFVDLVCYRRHGHNELDDPTFTQPLMYKKVAGHQPVSRRYAERLVREGVLGEAALQSLEDEITAAFRAAHQRARLAQTANGPVPLGGAWVGFSWAGTDWSAGTAAPRERLEQVTRALAAFPPGFHPHRKIAQLAAERARMLAEDRVDWGLGEALAIGTLLLDGDNVRLSGQDTERGTFSHRHAVLHDMETGERFVPLRHLAPDQGRFEVFDTPLSEAAVLGFEHGYSTADPRTLVIWEAQFGDFANVAQVYIDQFIASAESKWRRMSGIVLLLPHGYEGQGPEHSSARLERFLELCANGNMQVCNPTTPAQLFHALRRQQRRQFRKPLVLMSPKSLLRHRLAISAARDFTGGAFQTVLDDATVADPAAVKTVLLTSGKSYYALHEARAAEGASHVALVRIEQLYPFPREELSALLGRYRGAKDIRWVQEEPANMGAWRSTRHRIEASLPEGARLRLVARKASPSPATGYYHMHVEQERRLLERALAEGVVRAAPPAAPAAAGTGEGGRS